MLVNPNGYSASGPVRVTFHTATAPAVGTVLLVSGFVFVIAGVVLRSEAPSKMAADRGGATQKMQST